MIRYSVLFRILGHQVVYSHVVKTGAKSFYLRYSETPNRFSNVTIGTRRDCRCRFRFITSRYAKSWSIKQQTINKTGKRLAT